MSSSSDIDIVNVFLLVSDDWTTSVYVFEDRIIHLDIPSITIHLNEAGEFVHKVDELNSLKQKELIYSLNIQKATKLSSTLPLVSM